MQSSNPYEITNNHHFLLSLSIGDEKAFDELFVRYYPKIPKLKPSVKEIRHYVMVGTKHQAELVWQDSRLIPWSHTWEEL